MPEMYAGLVFLGLLGYVLNRLFLLVERHLSPGTRGSSMSGR